MDIKETIIHNVYRFVGVLMVGLFLALISIAPAYVWGQRKYKAGYSQALTDHPQNVYNAPTTVNQNAPKKEPFVYLKIWFIRLSGG